MTLDNPVSSPYCDRPAKALCRASHASDRVNHLGVPDQFKNILIAGTVAIGIGIGQIKAHSLRMGKDQFALAPAIGQWGNQRAGIDGILLRGLCRKDLSLIHISEPTRLLS